MSQEVDSNDLLNNLLFASLALQNRLVEENQLEIGCRLWLDQSERSLADILVEQGYLNGSEKDDVQNQVRKLVQTHSSPKEALICVITNDERMLFNKIGNPQINQILVELSDQNLIASTSRYSLVNKLAEGGLGKILVARDNSLNRNVAFKKIKSKWQSRPEYRQLFIKEAQITGQLEHPSIVPVYELVENDENQESFYTMRLIEGKTLDEAIKDHHSQEPKQPLSFQRLLTAFVSVCNAISYAHNRGVIHRDLKPANIVLGEFGEVIVLDWGLAKVLNEPETLPDIPHDVDESASPPKNPSPNSLRPIELNAELRKHTVGTSGTPSYMAPEQALGAISWIDFRTDIYGLGAVLFEILTGSAPFGGRNVSDILKQIATKSTPQARQRNPSTPLVLNAICAKAMAKQREKRYQTAQALGDDVLRWLADEPVGIVKDPLQVRARRWMKRHPALTSSIVSVAAMILVVLAVVGLVQKQHNQELGLANNKLANANQQLGEANQKLAQANELARDELNLAMEAIKSFHTGVAEDVVLNNPDLQQLRLKLLKEPQAFYERLLERLKQVGADSEHNQALLAKALFELSVVNLRKGSVDTAITSCEASKDLFVQLTQKIHDNFDYQTHLAESLNHLGHLYIMTDQAEKAQKNLLQALETGRKLTEIRPGEVKTQINTASHHQNLGISYSAVLRINDAENAYLASLKILEQLAKDNKLTQEGFWILTKSQRALSMLYRTTNRTEQAEALLKKAQSQLESLIKQNHSNPKYESSLGDLHCDFAEIHRTNQRADLAEKSFLAALKIREQSIEKYPTVVHYRTEWASCHNNLGLVYSKISRPQEAEKSLLLGIAAYEQAVKMAPSINDYQTGLASSHSNLGALYFSQNRADKAEEHQLKAKEIFERIAKANPTIVSHLTNVAKINSGLGVVQVSRQRYGEAEKTYLRILEIQERIVKQNPTVSDHQLQLAISHNNIAAVFRATRQPERAEKSLLESVRILKELIKTHPNHGEMLSLLAANLTNLGGNYRDLKRYDDSEKAFLAAIEVREKMVKSHPKVSQHHYDIGCVRRLLGEIHLDTKRFQEAEQSYKTALNDFEQAVKTGLKNPLILFESALAHRSLAKIRRKTARWEEADQYFQTSIQQFESMVQDAPLLESQQIHFASVCIDHGSLLLRRQQPQKAQERFDQAETLVNAVLKRPGAGGFNQAFLQSIHMTHAQELTQENQHKEAMVHWDLALKHAVPQHQVYIQIEHAIGLLSAGRVAESIKSFQHLKQNKSLNNYMLYNLACLGALASASVPSQKEQLTAETLELLSQLSQSGFFQDPANAQQLQTEPAFNALRDRPEFSVLLKTPNKTPAKQ